MCSVNLFSLVVIQVKKGSSKENNNIVCTLRNTVFLPITDRSMQKKNAGHPQTKKINVLSF